MRLSGTAAIGRWPVVLAVVTSVAVVGTVTDGGLTRTQAQRIATNEEALAFEDAVCQSVQHHTPPPPPIRVGPNKWEIAWQDKDREGVPPGAETVFVACAVDVSGA
jgi:hypothetical protein